MALRDGDAATAIDAQTIQLMAEFAWLAHEEGCASFWVNGHFPLVRPSVSGDVRIFSFTKALLITTSPAMSLHCLT